MRSRSTRTLSLAAGILPLLGCSLTAAWAQTTRPGAVAFGHLRVTVRQAEDNRPVRGADIILRGSAPVREEIILRSDRQGSAISPPLEPGAWHVTTDVITFQTEVRSVAVTAGTTTEVQVLLQKKTLSTGISRITIRRAESAAHQGASQTSVPAESIEQNPAPTSLNNVVAATVPGAVALPDRSIRIRGSDNQYSYYLDGVSLPADVSGAFVDQINPKDIQTLRVYTGGFPAEYGNQLGAIFDVTPKAGRTDKPGGLIQQSAAGFNTYETSVQYGSGHGNLSYFASGFRSRTDFRLSPITQTPLHNGGTEDTGFAKLDYQSGPSDRWTLDLGLQDARIQIPNSPARQAVGQDDNQKVNRQFTNFIWRHLQGPNVLRLALYSHRAQVRFDGSPQDLLPSPGAEPALDENLILAYQHQTANYLGLRGDYTLPSGQDHRVQLGFDVNQVHGRQAFSLTSPPASGFTPITDNRALSGGDRGVYVQDDWTRGRFRVNYGVRYDVHKGDTTDSQLSPRLNLHYRAGSKDTFYAFYNRLFLPVPIEDIKHLVGSSTLGDNLSSSPLRSERDHYYEAGWERHAGKTTFSLDAYYKSIQDILDNQELGDTKLEVSLSEAKAFLRGVEFALDGSVARDTTFYGSYARSWHRSAGPVVGGLLGANALPPGYFIDDHDQTAVASLGLSYEGRRVYATLGGEYGSGLPYGEQRDANGDLSAINFRRVPPHLVLNLGAGTRQRSGLAVALTVSNLLNHGYLIAQDSLFRRPIWGQGRTVGLKLTQSF